MYNNWVLDLWTMIEPFDDSSNLAFWSASKLSMAGVDELARWRMLEYWMQVELFQAIETCEGLSHAGCYEQPYFTKYSRTTSKTNYKWIDLLIQSEREMCWVELKDLGRSSLRVKENSKGLGFDLAALTGVEIEKTVNGLIDPPPHIIDKARLKEWAELAEKVSKVNHSIAQIVMAPKSITDVGSILEWWSDSYTRRTGVAYVSDFGQAETKEFWIIGTIQSLGNVT